MRGIVWLASATAGLLILVAAVMLLRGTPPERSAQPPAAASQAAMPKPAAEPAASSAVPPSFDIVTVDRHGQAVIAGRAMPGDRVRVLDGDKSLGEVTADQRGEWALVPETRMPPGNRQLSLEATAPGGGAARRSSDVVALSVTPPASPAAGPSTLAVLLPREGNRPARVLQQPSPGDGGRGLSLDSVEYGAGDRLILSGRAEPGARLNIYAGERLLGSAAADGAGKWSLAASHPASAGSVELRLAELAADGSVAQRIAASLAPVIASAPPGGGTYVVARGNSLWLIARHLYGNGTRYTTIYRANREQISDPDLIYPGQQFKLPHS